MQSCSSLRVVALGSILFVSFFDAASSLAQFSQTGTSDSSDQSSCSSSDPSCQSDQSGFSSGSLRQPSGGQTSTTGQQGIVLPGQSGNSTDTTTNSQQRNTLIRTPLDPPTEFQQMVANSTGKMLPIYGVNLFRQPPSTFAPAANVPVTPDYVIGPGDELLIQVWGQVSLNTRLVVDRTGTIYIPQVGSVHVAGIPFAQVHDFLKSQMGRVFRNFDLNVNMGQLRSIQVFVVGQARRPGSYTISSLSTITNALFATGGPTPQGSLRHIQLKRAGKVIVEYDLYDLLLNGDKSKDEQLLPGDVIYIPPVGPQVAVTGSVNVPAIYELKSAGTTTVADALKLAAGLNNVASTRSVRIERVDEHQQRAMTVVPLDANGLASVLQDGDLLELTAVVSQYKDAITLRGNVANPGRYTWKPGMRVLDLIPTKDALITREYWLKRSQIGQPMLSYIPTCPPATPFGIPSLRYGIPVGDEGQDTLWRYSSIQSQNLIGTPYTGASRKSPDQEGETDGSLDCANILPPGTRTGYVQGPDGNYYNSSSVPGTLNGQNGQSSQNTLQAPNAATATGPNSIPLPSQQNTAGSNKTSAASESVGASNANASSGQFLPRNDVKLNEPDIDWSYAVVERQSKENLTTSLLPFNLGKAVLEGDASQNLELMPGDVVTIFSKADIRVPQAEQTRYVRLEGEFASSGVYSVRPGETLRQLIQRAGGFTSDAYLYGSEFTRESTRRVQQQRLNEYVDEIALQVSTNATNNAGRALSATDAAAATAAQAQNQAIVTSLRQARASGRIVLELTPDTHDLSQIPDLPLEDGDRFIVPRIPSTVSVDGAVYNQNSFVYDPNRRLGGYLRLAGGINRDADKNRAYVIRASGSVVSKQYSSSLRGNNFDSIHVYPGDTVVVPLNLTRGNTIRLIVDIAQIVGQFGLAAATAAVVF